MLRPKKIPPEEKPFERRSRPTPQATRLLFTSTLAGLGLVLVLAVVFIPRALHQEGLPQAPVLYLDATIDPFPVLPVVWRVNVTLVSLRLPLSDYEVELTRLDVPVLNRTSLTSLSSPVSFTDTDSDGYLTVGDVFHVTDPTASTKFFVYHAPSGKRIGFTGFP